MVITGYADSIWRWYVPLDSSMIDLLTLELKGCEGPGTGYNNLTIENLAHPVCIGNPEFSTQLRQSSGPSSSSMTVITVTMQLWITP
jgi:hypothetical protein